MFFKKKPDIQLDEYKKALCQRDTEILKLKNNLDERVR